MQRWLSWFHSQTQAKPHKNDELYTAGSGKNNRQGGGEDTAFYIQAGHALESTWDKR